MQKALETKDFFAWNRLSFPYWKHQQLGYEELSHVGVVAQARTGQVIQCFGDSASDSGWIVWIFVIAVSEKARLEMQADLEAYFGEPAKDFCWDGTRTVAELYSANAIGRYIQ